ncbi:MAG: ArgE/DapE family deacylase [Gaiellaceae bacterium]
MGQSVAHNWDVVDEAIDGCRDTAIEFLRRLVAEPSVVGHERGAQRVVAAELARLGFEVRELEVPEDIHERRGAGVPQLPYAGRPVVVGERRGAGRSLLVNGHVDVVPPGPVDLWLAEPFEPRIVDGWLYGRGAGDMKAGFAMAMLAIEALLEAAPETLSGPLSFVSVIEEECTGNGTLAAAQAGVLADAVLLPEPTNLEMLLDGIGVLWLELMVQGRSAHAHLPQAGANAIELVLPLLTALRDVEVELNPDGGRRHALNVGTFHAGDWQSSVAGVAHVGVRIGFPREWSAAEAQARVTEALERAARQDRWLAEHPPTLRFNGFRAEGYTLDRDHEVVQALSAAHAEVVGTPPSIQDGTATTDARYYLNNFGVPALCYGPTVRNMHGIDEAVELESVVTGARVLARFLARWYGGAR